MLDAAHGACCATVAIMQHIHDAGRETQISGIDASGRRGRGPSIPLCADNSQGSRRGAPVARGRRGEQSLE